MKIQIKTVNEISPSQSVVCIVGKDEIPPFISLTKIEKGYVLRKLREKVDYVHVNSYDRSTYFVLANGKLPAFRMLEELRKNAATMKKLIKSNSHKELVIASDGMYNGAVEAFTEGLILSIYSFDKYRTKEKDDEKGAFPGKVLLYGINEKSKVEWLNILCEAVYKARDLINEPPAYLNASVLAREIRKMGDAAGFSVEVLNKGKIESLKMGGILAVNRGSIDPPVFCILEWNPHEKVNEKPIVLIGKGIIYDTGGLNIKVNDYMSQMKADMAGAAAVAGVLYVLAKCRIPLHVIGLVPATDNRPGGNAYVQGDVITMFNKSTVEVVNTDAEGRLILADAISYAGKYKPGLIISIATLTGSAAMTFSNKAIALMGNAEEKFFTKLEEAGNEVYERVARLPFWDDYRELLKSDIADIKNSGGREAGAITAGKFLETFTEFPFLHLDIAGTGILKKDDYYRTKEGPGSGLRLLAVFLKKLVEENIIK